MDEVWANPARTLFVQNDGFKLNTRQSADPRTDRAARAYLRGLIYIGQPGIFERLASGIDAVNDERIHLPLDLMIDPFARIEAPRVIGGFHFASNRALVPGGIEPRDRTRTVFAGDQVSPDGFDIGPQRGDQAKPGNNNTAHAFLRKLKCNRPSPLWD